MAAKSSIAHDIIWNWVIETLANSEQADASTLTGLVRMAPTISSGQGKDAREAVSLRILESLFLQGDEAVVDTDLGQNGKISFDSSESCENVLHQILRETPEHLAKLEKEKWDIRPFLTHKRSSLFKCALKKLKESILESSNPLLASLKERSKVVIPNASENSSPVNEANFDFQDTIPEDDSANLNPRKVKGKFQEAGEVVIVQDHEQQIHSNNENLPKNTYEKRASVESMENLEFVVKSKDNNVQQPNVMDDEPLIEEEEEEEKEEEEEEEKLMEEDDEDDVQPARIDVDHSQSQSQTDSLINLCVKCNSEGDLLVCSSDSCPLQVHERCLGFEVTLDEYGDFFCPFCAYSRAISKYQEAKRKASKARKDLQSFSSFKVKDNNRPNNQSFKKQSEFENNEERQTGAFGERTKGNVANQSMTEGDGQKKVNDKANEKIVANQSMTEGEGQKKVNEKVNERNVANQSMAEGEGQKKVNEKVSLDKHIQNSKPQASTPKGKSKKKESQRANESSCSRELRKRKAQSTPPPPVRFSRRRIIPWTKSEEETLKEGVERYSSVNDKKIPWKDILDFGHNKFNKGRTSVDLKDKWRNICKGANQKGQK